MGSISIQKLAIDADVTFNSGTFTTTLSAGTSGTFGDITISDGSIVSSSGAISFGDENLTTTGGLKIGKQINQAIGAAIASATALPALLDGNYAHVTGTAAITSIITTGTVGSIIWLEFDDVLVLTHHATNLILPGEADITTAAGDVAGLLEYGAGTYKGFIYSKKSGAAVISGGGGAFATSGTENLFAGTMAGDSLTTGTNNFFAGLNAGTAITDGTFNVVIGSGALDASITADHTIAIGTNVMGAAATGADNICLGQLSGSEIVTAARNVCIGLQAGDAMTAGSDNIAIGTNCMGAGVTTGDSNVSFGTFAGSALTSGSRNVSAGFNSGGTLTSGDWNVCIGSSTGLVWATGNNNIAIGESLAGSSSAVSDEIIIGHDITGAGVETTKIGSPTDNIVNDWGENATWTHSSDMRMKNIIGRSPLGLDFINSLNPVEFTKKPASQWPEEWGVEKDTKIDTDKIYQGMVAQEVRKALDVAGVGNFGGWREDADGRQRIGDAAFVFPLIRAVQELSAQIKELKRKI